MDNKISYLADCICSMLEELDTRVPKSFYISKQQIDTIVADPEVKIDVPYLVKLQQLLINRGIAFISLPTDVEKHRYWVMEANNVIFSKAASIGDNQIRRVMKVNSITLDSIRALTDYGFTTAELARATCSSIGHSRVGLRGISRGQKDREVCLRCGRAVKAQYIVRAGNFVTPLPLTETGILGWKDLVNVPDQAMEQFALAFHRTAKQVLDNDWIQDPDAAAMVPYVEEPVTEPVKTKKRDSQPKSTAASTGKAKTKKESKAKAEAKPKPKTKNK